MTITRETSLRNFQPWGGAKAVFYRLTLEEINILEMFMEEIKDTWDELDINDYLWFDTEQILADLAIDEEEFWKREER